MFNKSFAISDKIRFLRIGNSLMFLSYYLILLMPNFNHIFGYKSGVDPKLFINYLKSPLFLVWDIPIVLYSVLAIAIISSLLFMFNFKHLRIVQCVLFVSNLFLHLANPFILHEAQYLNNILLFSLFFVSLDGKDSRDGNILNILLIFLGVYYFLAAVKKLPDPHWLEGTAVGLIANFDALTKGSFVSDVIKNKYLSAFFTYSTLLFEFLFFPLVFTRFKSYLMIIGIMFHLGIYLKIDVGFLSFTMISFYPLLLQTKEDNHVDI